MARHGWLVAGAALAVAAGEAGLALDGAAFVVIVADAVAGSLLLGAAVAGVARTTERRLGAILGLAGLAWLAANAVPGLAPFHRPLLVHAVLASPDGRLRGRVATGAVWVAWPVAILTPDHALANVVLGVVVASAGLETLLRSSISRRRWSTGVAQAAVLLGIALGGPAIARLEDPTNRDADLIAAGYAVLVAIVGGLLLLRLLLRSDGAPEVADTVVELTGSGSREVDEVIALVRRGDASTSDPAVTAAISSVTALLEDNRALHARLQGQVEEVRRSRLRLVEAGDLERRRLARRLAATAGKQLAELDATLRVLAAVASDGVSPILERAMAELDGTRDDLDQLAQGLHPRVLVEEGLRGSLEDLACRSVVPAEVSAPDVRFPPLAETTIWYVCAEAAANVAKHASAHGMRIEVTHEADRLVATIADDGIGGVEVGAGSGLPGLADRLDAVGGRLELRSVPGEGTRLRAWVPLA